MSGRMVSSKRSSLPREAIIQRLRDDADAFMLAAEDHERMASKWRAEALAYRAKADDMESHPGRQEGER